jgi:hypothetical protein
MNKSLSLAFAQDDGFGGSAGSFDCGSAMLFV